MDLVRGISGARDQTTTMAVPEVLQEVTVDMEAMEDPKDLKASIQVGMQVQVNTDRGHLTNMEAMINMETMIQTTMVAQAVQVLEAIQVSITHRLVVLNPEVLHQLEILLPVKAIQVVLKVMVDNHLRQVNLAPRVQ